MKRPRLTFALLIALVAVLSGCAGLPAVDRADAGEDARGCLAWYEALDRAVDAQGARDAGETRIDGFPYLRTDRFGASFRDAARTDAQLRKSLLAHLADLDQRARRIEIANLPATQRPEQNRLALCGARLAAADEANPARIGALLDRLAVPDDYSTAKRAAGLYALSSIPFFAGVTRWQEDTQAVFASNKSTLGLTRFAAAVATEAPINLAGKPRNAMGIPALTASELQQLLARHAPVLDVTTRGAADRFGAMHWRSGGFEVDTQVPVGYTRIAFTRFNGETLLQLVYTYWFPARPAGGAFDLLSGKLDGLMVRITLDTDGAPLIVDSIHACGCYQLFFPTPRLAPRPPPEPQIEWAFVPKRLPLLSDGERVAIRVAPGTHYLEDIGVVAASMAGASAYSLIDDDQLRSLPVGRDENRSLYGSDGIVAGSERGERFLFWPMGIASPGAMRQWGRHATAFVGRRHFDDADLIERRFERTK